MNKRKLAKVIRNSFLGRSKWYMLLRYYYKKKDANIIMHRFLHETIAFEDQKKILKNMKDAMVNYRWEFDEFFLYHFWELNHQEKQSFVVEFEKNLFCDMVNENSCQEIFDNKWKTYERFRKYFNREVVLVLPNDSGIEAGSRFLENHKTCILKPIVSSLGRGVRKVNVTTEPKNQLESLLKEYSGGIVLEEVIKQAESLSKLHPQSVNTLRIHTLMTKNGPVVFKPYLRMGRGWSVVDNAGAGGIFTSVDFHSGRITKAVDEMGNSYNEHPDTKINLIGYEIPKWQEAIELAKNLALIVPKNRYTGWDLALTESGWCMVEGNTRAQFVFQIPEQKGFRELFNDYKKQL